MDDAEVFPGEGMRRKYERLDLKRGATFVIGVGQSWGEMTSGK